MIEIKYTVTEIKTKFISDSEDPIKVLKHWYGPDGFKKKKVTIIKTTKVKCDRCGCTDSMHGVVSYIPWDNQRFVCVQCNSR